MPKYRLTAAALGDFEAIGRYTETYWGARQRRKYLGDMMKTFEAVGNGELKGLSRSDLKPGLWVKFHAKHSIFFRWDKNVAEIVRILGQRQSPEKAFDVSRP